MWLDDNMTGFMCLFNSQLIRAIDAITTKRYIKPLLLSHCGNEVVNRSMIASIIMLRDLKKNIK